VSSLGIVWRSPSVNIEGGPWWDSCLFSVLHIPLKVSVHLLVGQNQTFSFLSANRCERSTQRLPICFFLDTEFSHRVQKGSLLFLSRCDLNTDGIQGVLRNFFIFIIILF